MIRILAVIGGTGALLALLGVALGEHIYRWEAITWLLTIFCWTGVVLIQDQSKRRREKTVSKG